MTKTLEALTTQMSQMAANHMQALNQVLQQLHQTQATVLRPPATNMAYRPAGNQAAGGYSDRTPGPCFRCGGPHLKRFCSIKSRPANPEGSAPHSDTNRQAGNDNRPAQ